MEKYEITAGIYQGTTDEELKPENVFREPYDDFCEELGNFRDFHKITPKMTSNYFTNSKSKFLQQIPLLDKEGKEEFERYKKWHKMIKKQKTFTEEKKLIITHQKLAHILNFSDKLTSQEYDFTWFFRKMSLVYLVSQFFEFLKSIVANTFICVPELVKNKIEVDFEELFEVNQIEDYRVETAYVQSEMMLRKGIDEINKSFKKIFNLNLSKNNDWNSFRDIFYRRNIIVHNTGKVNKQYLEKMKKSESNIDVRITDDYLKASLDLFEKYSKQIWTFFNKKYFSKAVFDEK